MGGGGICISHEDLMHNIHPTFPSLALSIQYTLGLETVPDTARMVVSPSSKLRGMRKFCFRNLFFDK